MAAEHPPDTVELPEHQQVVAVDRVPGAPDPMLRKPAVQEQRVQVVRRRQAGQVVSFPQQMVDVCRADAGAARTRRMSKAVAVVAVATSVVAADMAVVQRTAAAVVDPALSMVIAHQ